VVGQNTSSRSKFRSWSIHIDKISVTYIKSVWPYKRTVVGSLKPRLQCRHEKMSPFTAVVVSYNRDPCIRCTVRLLGERHRKGCQASQYHLSCFLVLRGYNCLQVQGSLANPRDPNDLVGRGHWLGQSWSRWSCISLGPSVGQYCIRK